MKGIAIATLVFTIIGVIVACLAIYIAKKLNKAVLRQNLELECHRIDDELKDIEVQIEREKSAGHAETRPIYGISHPTDPHIAEINALWDRKAALEKRKDEIEAQLKQL